MNTKKIIKRFIYFFASVVYKVRPSRTKKIKDREPNLIDLHNIAPDHQIYSENTFIDAPLKDRYDLCLVIPFYCVEQSYLEDCLESLLNQKTNYSYRIICIEDGSTDDTLVRLMKYANNYPDRIYVFHQENSGISCARNSGIKLSNSEYIGFVDQDDWVDDTYVEKLLSCAKRYDADIVKCSHRVVCKGKTVSTYAIPTDFFNGTENVKILSYSGMIWSGIYKSEILKSIRFPEKYWYEDMIARNLLYRSAEKFASISDVLYSKRKHDTNASDILWNGKSNKCFDHLYLFKHILEENDSLGLDRNLVLKKSILIELGQFLMWRTRGQNRFNRICAFSEACYIVQDYVKNDNGLSPIEKCYLDNYLRHDYYGWILTSWRDWAITA